MKENVWVILLPNKKIGLTTKADPILLKSKYYIGFCARSFSVLVNIF